ncbi:RNA-guided endonuclease InsQ/TnpB family protein [Desmospora activa]|uniref:Putative transposase n=1 Tax=Desmospora activa DSM 45169 TaxID=1121389 RepID=A0A2T4ZDB4_9BACL|nr:RNA-guided endonuclease TnpB family protein [Desmospora activa]PTM59866.1 putative transposase [Desmospora activa DSM 45169]
MLRAFKTELHPTPEQCSKIAQTIGVCRFLYNRFLAMNFERHQAGKPFMSGYDFDKYVNHELSKTLPWIKQTCGSKARKKAIMNAQNAFNRFFHGHSRRPRLKKKQRQETGAYFPKNNKGDLLVERHRIKIPTLGWTRLKEYGYIPTNAKVVSCTLTKKADRYYISVLVEVEETSIDVQPNGLGIGVDLGIKGFAFTSEGKTFRNINQSSTVKQCERRLKRAQRALSRKYEAKKRGEKPATEGGSNIRKNILRVQKLHQRLANKRKAYRAWVVSQLVKTKPASITIEHLNVRGMMRNRHLAKAIAAQGFYDFKQKLIQACQKRKIQLREVALFYPSSKLCSCCGAKKVTLSLSERIFHCDHCGYEGDRDVNAAMNLAQAREYAVLT